MTVSPERSAARLVELLEGRRAHAVWAFGSRARGKARAGSDLDLGLLCEPPLDVFERGRHGDLLAMEIGVDVDLVDLKTANPILAWEVVTTGRIVWEQSDPDDETVERFVRMARFAAEDADQINRMILSAAARP